MTAPHVSRPARPRGPGFGGSRTAPPVPVGLRAVAGELAGERLGLDELARRGLLTSPVAALAESGFEHAHVATDGEGATELARRVATAALEEAGVAAGDVDALFWVSALPRGHVVPAVGGTACGGEEAVLADFRYSGSWLQEALGLDRAAVTAVTQQGCASMFASLRLARGLLLSEPEVETVLCVGVDVLPPGAHREILYNVISDAACAVVLTRDSQVDRWLGYRQLSRGSSWDPVASRDEILASYFPTARLVIEEAVEAAGLRPDDVDRVIPTGVTRASWEILMDLTGIPADRLVPPPAFGHTILADPFLVLADLRRRGELQRGERALLFTYGFGSSWAALLLEH